VLAITEPVTRDTAPALVARVNRVAAGNRVVVDLTDIPAFDSEGAAALVGLQESLGDERVTILGFRQATERLLGSDLVAVSPPRQDDGTWVLRRMRAIAVIQTSGDGPASTDNLEPLVRQALDEEVGIVVVDLRNARLTRAGIDTIAFASSAAALRGQELLVVNVDGASGEELRGAGLSASTYVAPEPIA
jgi:anti-anti-sigma regulatory factor